MKNKVIVLFVAIFAMLIINNTNVWGFTYYDPEYDIEVDFGTEIDTYINSYENYYVSREISSNIIKYACQCFFTVNDPKNNARVNSESDGSILIKNVGVSSPKFPLSFVSFDVATHERVSSSLETGANYFYYYPATNSTNYGILLYLKQDVYYKGNLVFQAPPQPTQAPAQQSTLVPLEAVEEIPQTMNQVLQIVLPIAMIAVAIFLLIFLIRYVILRMLSIH